MGKVFSLAQNCLYSHLPVMGFFKRRKRDLFDKYIRRMAVFN